DRPRRDEAHGLRFGVQLRLQGDAAAVAADGEEPSLAELKLVGMESERVGLFVELDVDDRVTAEGEVLRVRCDLDLVAQRARMARQVAWNRLGQRLAGECGKNDDIGEGGRRARGKQRGDERGRGSAFQLGRIPKLVSEATAPSRRSGERRSPQSRGRRSSARSPAGLPPAPGRLRKVTVPPCCSAMARASVRPSPAPPVSRLREASPRENGSIIAAISPSAMPGPSSSTRITTVLPSPTTETRVRAP